MYMSAVGRVDGCGYDGQLKDVVCDARGTGSGGFQAAWMPRSPQLHVTIFMKTMTDIQTDCFTPCACAWGNKGLFLELWVSA